MEDNDLILQAKQRFGIIGNSEMLNIAIDTATKIAPTDLNVLITGESGVGKENIAKIIHQFSNRKHGQYIAVNCGAIPEGTIESELFGHEKGSYTDAKSERKGYFEVAEGGTIFLDEVGELPLGAQAKLLRVLENHEYMRVGSSKTIKSNVRVIAATNVNLENAIKEKKFRADLYYRLNVIPIEIPALRNRKEDINLLFRKFAENFSEKYKRPAIRLDADAQNVLTTYHWPGNIRELMNVAERLTSLEKGTITKNTLLRYLPKWNNNTMPSILTNNDNKSFENEREILYQVLFDLKKDVTELKKLVADIITKEGISIDIKNNANNIIQAWEEQDKKEKDINNTIINAQPVVDSKKQSSKRHIEDTEEYEEETLSLEETERDLIKKALDRNRRKRKATAKELGISERTLYRKIKELGLE